ncbi:M28 family peptidase [Undibacterium cyanobacteriorum]|uniref:M28 family peptidase n=1 Tax=Undibacterium cyanobacteriorum TaxID=3073561 RepID=A0ABY9RDQ3_9BURK|nr:M28 family peptidase [Undibacterium sp. 20NA77.5]WMW79356.1 M28 family peptidase [Undibacterium sp. 20NA77.5]
MVGIQASAQTEANARIQAQIQSQSQSQSKSGGSIAPKVRESALRSHLAYLADDLLEGRGTGQRGGELAARYIATQLQLMGLQNISTDVRNPYLHKVNILGIKTLPETQIRFEGKVGAYAPQLGSEILLATSSIQEAVDIDAPMIFVGYGIKAPEENWDDYKNIDVRGKVLVMMVNDPQPTELEPQRFAGKAMTYFGRWVYKFEEAARRGVAGVILIHTDASAAYSWSVPQTSFGRERFHLAGSGNPMEGWWAEASIKPFFATQGIDLDALRAQAEKSDFVPVELPIRVHASVRSTVRQVEQFNVLGLVPGTDAKLKNEALIYSAHWDHLGKIEEPGKPSQIWNGAVDNASGAAALLAMAEYAVKHPSKRSQIFLWPAAEEQGLIGSLAYTRAPAWPLKTTIADLNLDSMNFVGKTKDIGVAGSERSSLYHDAQIVARQMRLSIAKSVPDLGGAYYRADHFNFARAGVPAFNVGSAVFSGDGYFEFEHEHMHSERKMKHFKNDYHTVRDRYDPTWDLSGMVQQAEFTLMLGYRLANAKTVPQWNANDPYRKIREEQVKAQVGQK